jgi:MFS family permease
LDQLGAIIGPVLASSLILFLGVTVRDIFWISFIPGAIALIILLLFVKEKVSKSTTETKILQGVKLVLKGRFLLLLLVVGVFSIGAFNFSIILAKAEDIGIPEAIIPLVYATINITHVVIAIPSGMLSDRIGREKVLIFGYGAFLLSALLLSQQIISPAYIFLVALVYGLYMGVGETIQRAMVPKYAPAELKGTAYGLYYLVVGTGFFIANAMVGALWTYAGSAVAASYSVVTSIVAIVGMILFLKARAKGT